MKIFLKNTISWDSIGKPSRQAICELCNLVKKPQQAGSSYTDPIYPKIVSYSWDIIPLKAKKVLISYGITK